MRVFLAGATGVIGVRLVPLLVGAGHTVAGMTRSDHKLAALEDLGAQPVLCDAYDRGRLRSVMARFAPDTVVHQLTDLPDDAAQVAGLRARNARMRSEGTSNLVAAAQAAGAARMVAQSIAWELPGDGAATIADHERMVLDAGGVVVRYGQLYGPGTYYETELPAPPRVHVDEAASRTVPLLDAAPGVVEIVE